MRKLQQAAREVHLHIRDGLVLEVHQHHAVRLICIEVDAVLVQQVFEAVLGTGKRLREDLVGHTPDLLIKVDLAAQEIRECQPHWFHFWDERIDLVLCRPADEQEEAQFFLRQACLQHEKAPVMHVVVLFVLKRWHVAENLADGLRHGNPFRIELPAIPCHEEDWLIQNLL